MKKNDCLFLSKDKKDCIALNCLDCSGCKFYKDKKVRSSIVQTLEFYRSKNIKLVK